MPPPPVERGDMVRWITPAEAVMSEVRAGNAGGGGGRQNG